METLLDIVQEDGHSLAEDSWCQTSGKRKEEVKDWKMWGTKLTLFQNKMFRNQ